TPAMSQREIFDSFVEAELHRRLIDAGIPAPSLGRENMLRATDGRGVLQMDLSWPTQHLLALIDGREFHARHVLQILADQDKRNAALAAGWRILEFTAWEVVHTPDAVVEEIESAIAASRHYPLPGPEAREPMAADAGDGGVVLAASETPLLSSLSLLT